METFRLLYVFVGMRHTTRRMLHAIVTADPTAQWTLQQLRDAIPSDHTYSFLIHDQDRIFSPEFDQSICHLGLMVLKTPVRSPQAIALWSDSWARCGESAWIFGSRASSVMRDPS